MGSGSGSLVGILLLADRYLFSPCHVHSRFRPGNTRTGRLVDSLEQWDQTFRRLHPDCIHRDISSEVSTFKLKYCTYWSSGQRVGGVDERHSRPRSPSDTALPVYSTMYMHRVPIQEHIGFSLENPRLLCPKIVDLHRNDSLTRMGAYTYQGVWARPAEDGFPFSWA